MVRCRASDDSGKRNINRREKVCFLISQSINIGPRHRNYIIDPKQTASCLLKSSKDFMGGEKEGRGLIKKGPHALSPKCQWKMAGWDWQDPPDESS